MKHVSEILRKPISYSEQLESKEWIEFGRKIRFDSENACQMCRQNSGITHVHHIFYEPDRLLWEYERWEVMLLCAPCHFGMHAQLKAFRKCVFGKMDPKTFQVLNGVLAAGLQAYDPLTLVHAMASFVSTPRLVIGQAKAWNQS
jgi:hypothetical protein